MDKKILAKLVVFMALCLFVGIGYAQIKIPQPLVKEECISFNLASTSVVNKGGNWVIVDSTKPNVTIASFPGNQKADADRTLDIIKKYGMNQVCFVRPGVGFQYELTSGQPPTGTYPNEVCKDFNPEKLSVSTIQGRWKIVKGSNVLFDFGLSEAQARLALSTIKKYGFSRSCSVGKPVVGFKYMTKQIQTVSPIKPATTPILPTTERVVKIARVTVQMEAGKKKEIVEDVTDKKLIPKTLRIAKSADLLKDKNWLSKRCKEYADAAMAQVNERIKATGSVPPNDSRWANDRNTHLKFCLGANPNQRRAEIKARQEWLDTSYPAPSSLEAKNITTAVSPDPDASAGLTKDYGLQIKLTWIDNSKNEEGFNIYRWDTKTGVKSRLINTVGSNITIFVDKSITNTDELYCYQVTAAFRRTTQDGQIKKESKYSNSACSYAAYKEYTPLPDFDGDGLPDQWDACPRAHDEGSATFYNAGCPDRDGDGYPDFVVANESQQMAMGVRLIADNCYNEEHKKKWGDIWGDRPSPMDTGPKPPPGCPFRYRLVWKGMEILNPSQKIKIKDVSGKEIELYNEWDDKPGEEPYVLFLIYNGTTEGGNPDFSTNRWCCGERVFEKKHPGSEWLPDDKTSGGKNIRDNGLQIFPGDRRQIYWPINRQSGIILGVTLMEKDGLIKDVEDNEASWLDIVKSVWNMASTAGTCIGSFGVGCIGGMAGYLAQGAELAFGQKETTTHIHDPDDYMGTNTWAISRERAMTLTSKNGVYPFFFEMPTIYYAVGQKFETDKGQVYYPKEPATMLSRQYFCLIREGVNDSSIKALCSTDKAVMEIPSKEIIDPDLQRSLQGGTN